TDAQSLVHAKSERRVQLGPHLTQGLGAGAKPEIGRAAAEEATEELARHLDGCHMVFVTAGMGGGTGTGAAPVIARMARERGILTVGVVTKPFDFEGPKRKKSADAGIEELQQFVDTLIVIPNQNLFRLANERTTFAEAFKMADNVLYMGVRGVTDLMMKPGLVNLDFADIRTVMAEMGKAMMGTGEAEGDDRARKAAESAISNPLLEDTSLRGARGVLINITGGHDMTLFEVDQATHRIREEVDEEANIIFGSSVEEDLNGRIRVSVVATGIDVAPAVIGKPESNVRPTLVSVGGLGATPASMAPIELEAEPMVVQATGTYGAQHAGQPQVPSFVRRAADQAPPPRITAPQIETAPGEHPVFLASVAPRAELEAMPAARPQPPAPVEPSRGGLRGLFTRVTGGGAAMMVRTLPPEPARAVQPPEPPRHAEQAPQDEMGIEIPTFLRRQSN
ncbi:MAG: cell division protein FtsZ, partial [Pseudomonadota bacterium]